MSTQTTAGAGEGEASAPAVLSFVVHDTPAAQGSKVRTRFGMRESNPEKLGNWREAVKRAAETAMHGGFTPLTGPVYASIVFVVRRPGHHFGTGRNAHVLRPGAPLYPATKPDIDKLVRSTFDALTQVGAWADDSRVVDLQAVKRFVGIDTMLVPGAAITIRAKGGAE